MTSYRWTPSYRWVVAALLPLLIVTAAGFQLAGSPGGQMKTFAESFLETLDEAQQGAVLVPYESPQRVAWHFIPKDVRKGVPLKEMNAAQRAAALRLVRAALSEAGYDKAQKIMALEDILQHLEGDGRRWARDSDLYYVTIFGYPSDDAAWGLSFEGHHMSLNFVCRDGKVVDSTPQFMGANPATVRDQIEGMLGPGTRVLRDEEQLAFDLVQSLTENQAELALIAEEAPSEIRFAAEPQAQVGEPEGIPYAKLSKDQQEILRRLVHVYTDAVAGPVAAERRALIQRSGWDQVHFAWAGAKKPGVGHYYRVRGDGFLIEFVNTQPDASGNPANHIHCVLRDLTGDFDLPIGQ